MRHGMVDPRDSMVPPLRGEGPFVNVDKYGVFGDGTTDETTQLQRALDNEQHLTFGRGGAARIFKTSGQLTLKDGHVLDLTGTTIKPSGSSSYMVLKGAGSISADRSLASDAAEFSSSVTLVAGSVAAIGLVVGDMVRVQDTESPKLRHQVSIVTSIAGEVIGLADPLYWTFKTANAALLSKVTPKTFHLINPHIDGTDNTGENTIGMELLYTRNMTIERAKFVKILGAGASLYIGYGLQLGGCRCIQCGTEALSDLHVFGHSRFEVSDILSDRAVAFASGFYGCAVGSITRLHSTGTVGRGFKLQTSAGVTVTDIHVDKVPSPGTGLSVVLGSRRNIIQGAHCYGGSTGLWIDGDYNVCTGVKAFGNTDNDVLIAGGVGNVVEGEWDKYSDAAGLTAAIKNGRRVYWTGLASSKVGTVLLPDPRTRLPQTMAARSATGFATQTSAADNSWFHVCWSPELSLFVAVGGSGTGNRVMTSPDGVAWTIRTSALDNTWTGVCWSPELSLFVAVSNDTAGTSLQRVMTSPDGITWTIRSASEANTWVEVVWAADLGLFVAVAVDGTNRVMTSTDGITWTARAAAEANQWVGICWSPELRLLVAVSQSGTSRVMTSPDGITWTARAAAAANGWRSVCWSPELRVFVAVAFSGTGNRIMSSPDGITWTARTNPVDNDWRGVCWSPEMGMFVAVAVTGTATRIASSFDGITWVTRTSPADNEWRAVCWSPERMIFVGVATTGTGNRAMTSRLPSGTGKFRW